MARQIITKIVLLGSYPALPLTVNTADLTETAADQVNFDSVALSGDDIVIAHNTDSGAHTVTFSSVVDDKNRTGDITAYSIGAGEIAVFRFKAAGWKQSDGYLYCTANSATVKFGAFAL